MKSFKKRCFLTTIVENRWRKLLSIRSIFERSGEDFSWRDSSESHRILFINHNSRFDHSLHIIIDGFCKRLVLRALASFFLQLKKSMKLPEQHECQFWYLCIVYFLINCPLLDRLFSEKFQTLHIITKWRISIVFTFNPLLFVTFFD